MKRTCILAVTFLLFLSACVHPVNTPGQAVTSTPIVAFTGTPEPTLTPTFIPTQNDPEPTQIALPGLQINTGMEGVYGFDSNINPLTGLEVTDLAKLYRRPVLTKISNFPAVGRPHAGLSLADIVFEYYIGEYMNRFLALYYSQDTPKAWPLRSGRLIDTQLTNMLGGILVYGDADPRVETIITRDLPRRAVSYSLSECPPVCGYATHSATGVWVDTAAVSEWAVSQGMDNERPDLTGLVFNTTPPPDGIPVNTLDVQYIIWNHGQWQYDPETGNYLRFIESWDGTHKYPLIPLIDQVNNEQVSFSNVVILFAEYEEFSPTYHDVHIWQNTSGQRAIYFRDGLMYEGTWVTSDPYKPVRLLNKNMEPMALNPGTTWFIIAGLNSEFSSISTDHYILNFAIP